MFAEKLGIYRKDYRDKYAGGNISDTYHTVSFGDTLESLGAYRSAYQARITAVISSRIGHVSDEWAVSRCRIR